MKTVTFIAQIQTGFQEVTGHEIRFGFVLHASISHPSVSISDPVTGGKVTYADTEAEALEKLDALVAKHGGESGFLIQLASVRIQYQARVAAVNTAVAALRPHVEMGHVSTTEWMIQSVIEQLLPNAKVFTASVSAKGPATPRKVH
jgi:hypothetical protein